MGWSIFQGVVHMINHLFVLVVLGGTSKVPTMNCSVQAYKYSSDIDPISARITLLFVHEGTRASPVFRFTEDLS